MKSIRHVLALAAVPALLMAACAGDAPVKPEAGDEAGKSLAH